MVVNGEPSIGISVLYGSWSSKIQRDSRGIGIN